ncbi:unnamed protein product [Bemisia tabaci]|uniref:Gamma-tubulin complex component n=1 Tax=Bemisia tabaci TaxID=7038 RepID=A0A9P0F2M5_BEMTA|nr:unnamed protein product [Bemisia tabaci]
MALAKVESLYQKDLNQLIRCLTGFEDEDENAGICYKYAMSHLLFNNYPSANKWEVNRKVDGVVEKLHFHGLPGRAEKLRLLVKKFISLKELRNYGQVDVEWQVLQLLLSLAYRPSDVREDIVLDEKELFEPVDSEDLKKKEKEEWAKYLRQDDYKFDYTHDDESDWSSLESDGEKEITADHEKDLQEDGVSAQFQYPPLFPRSEPEAKYRNREEYLRCMAKEGIMAQEFLATQVQHSWWDIDQEIAKMGDSSNLSFKDLANSWRRTKDNRLLMVLSEEKVLREILWTLHCPSSGALFQMDGSGSLSVKQNFTLPTASQEATFQTVSRLSHLLQVCQEMSSFRESIDFIESSFTLQAYANTLAEVLEEFTMKILLLERKLNEHEDDTTLLHLEEIIAPYYHDLMYVYQIHQKATELHGSKPKWLAVARLLAELEIGLMEATSCRQTDFMLRLFVKSLRPSIDILDKWLSIGKLEDFRDEFLICRSDEDNTHDSWILGSFVVRRDDRESQILNCLAGSALKAAQSMEFALKMGDEYTVFSNTRDTGLMSHEFLAQLGEAILEAFPRNDSPCEDTKLQISSVCTVPEFQPDMQYFKDLCRFHPLIFQSIKTMLAEVRNRVKDCKEARERSKMNFQSSRADSYNRCIPKLEKGISVFPLNSKIEAILEHLIISKHDPAAYQFVQHLISDALLLRHLETMHKVYLLISGHTLSIFYNRLFLLAEADMWKSARSLSPLLEECIEKDVGELSERFEVIPKKGGSATTKKSKPLKAFKISNTLSNLDNFYINYQVESPVNIVITEEAVNSYNFVFKFLAKIEWAKWSLQQLQLKDLSKTVSDPVTRRLFYLRFFLLNSVSHIHNYFIRQISGDVFETVKNDIIDAPTLDAVIKAHKSYLRKLTSHCLIEEEVLEKGLLPYLSLCERLRELWKEQVNGSLEKQDVVEFEKYFIQTHWLLTTCVDTSIDTTSIKYAGPLTELWKVLSTNIPSRGDALGEEIVHLPSMNF